MITFVYTLLVLPFWGWNGKVDALHIPPCHKVWRQGYISIIPTVWQRLAMSNHSLCCVHSILTISIMVHSDYSYCRQTSGTFIATRTAFSHLCLTTSCLCGNREKCPRPFVMVRDEQTLIGHSFWVKQGLWYPSPWASSIGWPLTMPRESGEVERQNRFLLKSMRVTHAEKRLEIRVKQVPTGLSFYSTRNNWQKPSRIIVCEENVN